MRLMSFSLTTPQFRARSKTVTRRLGWWDLQSGVVLEGVEKGMGLRRGEKVVRLGQIRVLSARREPLSLLDDDPEYGAREAVLEGFPHLDGRGFVLMFCEHNRCDWGQLVNRIEFEYLEGGAHG